MKKLFVMLGIIALASCSVQTKEVLIDGKYDVLVGSEIKNEERVYFVTAISLGTRERPPLSQEQEVYVKAIERVAQCPVVPSSIRWEDVGVASNAVMRATVSC